MAVTAQELITKAFYLSGIVSRGLQSVTGEQISNGLDILNGLLGWKSIETDLIPYNRYDTSISTIAGQEKYIIPNALSIDSITFTQNNVQYAMNYVPPAIYFGSGRVDGISSLPFNYTYTREKGGIALYLYFAPQDVYQLKIWGKFGFLEVELNTDLSEVYDEGYLEFLRYSLAKYICSEYGVIFNPESEQILKQMKRELMYVTPPNLEMEKSSIFDTGCGMSWAQINLGHGWTPR